MTTTTLAAPTLTRRAPRRPWTVAALLCLIALGLGIAFPGHALDLVAFTGITGPLTSALTQIASLGPGIKALVGFVGFVVALISLAALRNFGPVLFYVGLAIFAAVGLAERAGRRISFWEFTRYGLVVTAITIAIATPYLWLRYFALT